MTVEQELELLRLISNIDNALSARNIHADVQATEILACLSRINSTLYAIDLNLSRLEFQE